MSQKVPNSNEVYTNLCEPCHESMAEIVEAQVLSTNEFLEALLRVQEPLARSAVARKYRVRRRFHDERRGPAEGLHP